MPEKILLNAYKYGYKKKVWHSKTPILTAIYKFTSGVSHDNEMFLACLNAQICLLHMTVTMPYLDDCFINIKMTVSKSAETW
jgi:hypothetical protein